MSDLPERPTFPLAGKVIIGALAVFGLLAGVQWLVGALFGLLRLLLIVTVVVALVGLVVWGGRDRDT